MRTPSLRHLPPLPGSAAINAGVASSLTKDQRGFARVSTPAIDASGHTVLSSKSFAEIYSYDGLSTDVAAPRITFVRTSL